MVGATLQYLLSFVFFTELGAVGREGLQKHTRIIATHRVPSASTVTVYKFADNKHEQEGSKNKSRKNLKTVTKLKIHPREGKGLQSSRRAFCWH